MTSGQMTASEAALVPLLVGKEIYNLTFVLDSSDSMRASLGSVKRLLIQTLLTKASLRNSLFNIITFSNKVNCWSHHMLPCAPDTVYTALSWIHSISCSPGRDLLTALSLALTDPACHAVHLITTALPDRPESLLRALPALAARKSVNIFFLQDGHLDIDTKGFLQCFTQATRGSCYLIIGSPLGKVGKVIPLYVAESQSSVPTFSPVKCCCPFTSTMMPQQHNMSSPLLRCSVDNSVQPLTSCMLSGQTLGSSEFFPGSRVLAKRNVDGLYHLGTVIQPVQGPTGIWVVEFDHPLHANLGFASSQRQSVCHLDMLNHHIRHQTHCLLPGDAVLSPWEPNLRRYGPGRVIAATGILGFGADAGTRLRVLMWNGCMSLVSDHLVRPISASHYDRIVRELQIPSSGQGRYCGWLGARTFTCNPQLFCTDCSTSASCCISGTNHWPCTLPRDCRSTLGGMIRSEQSGQHKQVDLNDTDVEKSKSEVPSSSSASLTEDETRATFPAEVKVSSKKQRPPWRYWRITGPEPQHRQPGSAVPKRTSQPAGFSFPVPEICASPNHSSMFQKLPGGRTSHLKPRPPVGLQMFSANNVTTVHS